MARLAKILAIVLVVLLVVVGGLALAAETAWFARLLARQASAAFERQVTVAGALDIDWSLRPRIHLPALTIANPDWAGEAPLARVERTSLTFDLAAVPTGRLVLHDLLLEQPRLMLVSDAQGRQSWAGLTGDGDGGGGPLAVSIDTVRIRDGRLRLEDAQQPLRLDLAVRTVADPDGGPELLRIDGNGRRQGESFELELAGGPLLAATADEPPYPLAGVLVSGDTRLSIDGSLRRPLAPERGEFALTARGPNPAVLEHLIGLVLPDLPPYDLHGRLAFEGGIWRFSEFAGTVGDSDLAGDLVIRTGEPVRIEADLTSRTLDIDDLLPAFGAAPAAGGGETASPKQRRQAQAREQQEEVLPEAEADRGRLQGVQAQVRFRGQRVNAPRAIPLDQVAFTLRLEDGVLRLDPVEFGVGGGGIRANLVLDANRRPARGELAANMSGVDLGELLGDFGVPSGGFGSIRGRLRTRFAGESVQDALGSADGSMLVYMTRGQVDAVLVALAGLDAGRALIEQFFGSGPTDIECAFVQLRAEDGRAEVKRFLIATEDIDLTAGGRIDLGKERMEIALRGYPRSPTVGASDAPVRVEGKFADAEITVLSDELLARGALAALAALVAPPLALVPFVHPGTSDEKEDVCRALDREVRETEQGRAGGA